MLQVLQDVKSRRLELADVPPPAVRPGWVRIRTAASLISAGTEKTLIDLGQKSLLGKAQARPDLVRKVLEKARKEGWKSTLQNVRSRLERPMPLGYSASGIVEAVGEGVAGLRVGDRVAAAGAGYANHAEVIAVPRNLTAPVPDPVGLEEAAYGTVAAIAMQGVRIASPRLGERVVVVGLGLIGLIAAQLLRANGCRVLGIDLSPVRVEQARALGIDEAVAAEGNEAVAAAERFTGGRGADHTLIAAATASNAPIELAGAVTRRKGRVTVVGSVGLDVPRDLYYKKELSVHLSMSYGPGRYDPSYEEGGIDYPYDYVRWTEQRNLEAALDLMARRSLDVRPLTTHRFPIERALEAYDLIQDSDTSYLGVLLLYDPEKAQPAVVRAPRRREEPAERLGVGFVGAGQYASLMLLPHVAAADRARLTGLVTAGGLTASQQMEKHGFAWAATDPGALFDDPETDCVFIATRHRTHAELTVGALEAGKHVFVEKPLCVDEGQLERVAGAYDRANAERPTGLMVGLNRRFSPTAQSLKERIPEGAVLEMLYRVNAGPISTDTWLHEPEEGGGMLIGEMCHFVDVFTYLCGERPVEVFARSARVDRADRADADNLTLVVSYDGGSLGTLVYSTLGDKAMPKERLDVFGAGMTAVLDDFRVVESARHGRRRRSLRRGQDKGQAAQVVETLRAFREEGQGPIAIDVLIDTMRVIFAARRSLRTGRPEPVRASTGPDPSTWGIGENPVS